MIFNETIMHHISTEVDAINFKQPYGRQQWKTAKKGPDMNNIQQFIRKNHLSQNK